MDMNRIDQSIPLNAIEIWEITNTMNLTHNFHVHGTHFQILERNGRAANVAAYENGYKDTVLLNPFDTVKLIIQMTDYTTDATAPYMFHCHILEHEDRGMMGQFIVV
jgi:FtsP/CotA-like multicopper oxidase with cupredoxin domain